MSYDADLYHRQLAGLAPVVHDALVQASRDLPCPDCGVDRVEPCRGPLGVPVLVVCSGRIDELRKKHLATARRRR